MKPFFQTVFNIMSRMQNAPVPMAAGSQPSTPSGSSGIQNNRQKSSSSESYTPGTPDATGVVTNAPPVPPFNPNVQYPSGTAPVPWQKPSFNFSSLLSPMAEMMGGGSGQIQEPDFLARYQAALAGNPLPELSPQSFQFQPMQNYFQGLPTQAVSPIQYPGIQDPTQRLMQDFLYRKSMLQ